MLRIPNPSALGNASTYIIIKDLSHDNNFIVRDPAKTNVEAESVYINNFHEPVYSPTLICEAVGKDSQMYVFSRDELFMPETEEEVIVDETE